MSILFKTACTHDQNRSKICATCGKNIKFGKFKPEYFQIKSELSELIKKHVNPNYSISDERFPISICVTCRLVLSERKRNILNRSLPIMPNYAEIYLSKKTRNQVEVGNSCYCYICITARDNIHSKINKGKGI